jgi:hypothetical protein
MESGRELGPVLATAGAGVSSIVDVTAEITKLMARLGHLVCPI